MCLVTHVMTSMLQNTPDCTTFLSAPTVMRSGLLSKAAGSAYAEFNTEAGPSTKVVVGV